MVDYVIQLSVDLCDAVPSVQKALAPIQDVLTTHGCGNLEVRGRILTMTMTSGKVLNRKERDAVKKIVLEVLNGHFPSFRFQVDSMRRQSRQSRGQSVSP